jgi:carboxymethylenebutenolidase
MDRKTAKDFDQELLNLFDQYVHGGIDRRGFLDRARKFAVGAAGPERRWPDPSGVRAVPLGVRILDHSWIPCTAREGLRQAAGDPGGARKPRPQPAHRRHRPSTRDRQFRGVRADALAPLGGYPGDEDKARELFPKLDQSKTREDFVAAAKFLQSRQECTGIIGAVGFCYGGGIVNMLATRLPDLGAGVPFYGTQPTAEEAKNIKAPLLLQYAETDDRINAGWPAYEAALKAANVSYTMHKYPGTQHGFNNDTTPRYDEAAAKLAWSRTVEFFNKHLR